MNTLFLVALIVEALFGIGFLIVPGPMMAPFGVTLDDTAIIFARMFGSAIITFPILLWFSRKYASAETRKIVVYTLFAYFLLSTIILLVTQLGGMMNGLGWIIIGIHTVLLVWFGYYLLK